MIGVLELDLGVAVAKFLLCCNDRRQHPHFPSSKWSRIIMDGLKELLLPLVLLRDDLLSLLNLPQLQGRYGIAGTATSDWPAHGAQLVLEHVR